VAIGSGGGQGPEPNSTVQISYLIRETIRGRRPKIIDSGPRSLDDLLKTLRLKRNSTISYSQV